MIHVALFAKPPVPGRTKSRLAAGIGDDAAAGFAKAALIDNLAVLREASVEASVWYPPETEPGAFGELISAEFAIREQRGDDLGERMAQAIDAMLAQGATMALVIGADCVTHTAANLAEVTALTVDGCLVLRPAVDGGFVLIGASQPLGPTLDDLAWGGADALAQVVQRCDESGVDCVLMDETFDVDVVDDLALAREWVGQYRPSGAVARWFAEFDG